MMVPVGDERAPDFVNRLLRTNFAIMRDLGPAVLKPFNQDVVQPRGLLAVLAQATPRAPLSTPPLVLALGPAELASWLGHFGAMLAFDAAHHALGARARAYADAVEADEPKRAFRLRRLAEQWEFGSGQDYVLTLPGDS